MLDAAGPHDATNLGETPTVVGCVLKDFGGCAEIKTVADVGQCLNLPTLNLPSVEAGGHVSEIFATGDGVGVAPQK